jgi:DNA-binding transcriptional LysR family regulator
MIRAGLGIGFGPAWMGVHDWGSGAVVETLRAWRREEVPLYTVRLDKRLTPKRVLVVHDFIVELTRGWHDTSGGLHSSGAITRNPNGLASAAGRRI